MTAGTNEKQEENSTSISRSTTTTNSEHETGSANIPGDDHGALANSHQMNLPVQTSLF
jgi:hypothetical protein